MLSGVNPLHLSLLWQHEHVLCHKLRKLQIPNIYELLIYTQQQYLKVAKRATIRYNK